MFLSTYILARALDLGRPAATGAAWTLPLLAHPYFGDTLLYPILSLVPNFGTMMSQFALVVASIYRLGRDIPEGRRFSARDVVLATIILLLLLLFTASQPLSTVIWAPSLAAISFALICVADKRERIVKLVVMIAVLLFFIVTGPAAFLYGMFTYSVAHYFPEALEKTMGGPLSVSILYGNGSAGPVGPVLFWAGTAGLALAVLFGNRRIRALSLAVLFTVACIVAAGNALLKWDVWRGPAALYFEFPLWAFYVIFAWWGVAALGQRLIGILLSRRNVASFPGWVEAFAVIAISVAIAGVTFRYAFENNNVARSFPLPPSKPPMVATLEERVGLMPGDPFRGRVATLELVSKSEPIGWFDLIGKDSPRYAATGNEYHWNGLWFHNIPTLFEYNQAMSPQFFHVITRLAGRQGDHQIRSVLVLRRAEARLLATVGVSFVITDTKLNEPFREVMSEKTHDDEVLFLYEVPNANVGKFGPTNVQVVSNYDQAVGVLESKEFDPSVSVVTFDQSLSSEKLSPLKEAKLKMVSGGYTVEAESDGKSLLILPLEFSHCLELQNAGANVRLVRVNALETGVLFEGKLSAGIQYFTGLFHNSTCRIKDASDFSGFNVRNQPQSALH
jgi:uncharacterized membrane protein (DUF373 family)